MPFLFALVCLLFSPALAHEVHGVNDHARFILMSLESTKVNITKQGDYLIIESNGIPNHSTGTFPNRDNPNAISAQEHNYRIPLKPAIAPAPTQMRGQPFGVAINGVPFDPGTAECYGRPRGGSPLPCEWREEALVNGKGRLGLDNSNAHVQPTGAYHYHGIPHLLAEDQPGDDVVHIGYAADGFKMMVSLGNEFSTSYRLKKGSRPGGPGGTYDGTYTADFEYVHGLGDLDECNGMSYEGEYVYMLTTTFPYVPRCWIGTPDQSFARNRPPEGMPPRHRRPPPLPHNRRMF